MNASVKKQYLLIYRHYETIFFKLNNYIPAFFDLHLLPSRRKEGSIVNERTRIYFFTDCHQKF